jgi:hypothetical protein
MSGFVGADSGVVVTWRLFLGKQHPVEPGTGGVLYRALYPFVEREKIARRCYGLADETVSAFWRGLAWFVYLSLALWV